MYLLLLSEPQFPHLKNMDNSSCLWSQDELDVEMYRIHYSVHTKLSTNESYLYIGGNY